MFSSIDRTAAGLFLIRIGISGVLLWFGAQQLLSPQDWAHYVPGFVLELSPLGSQTWVLLNGIAELSFGTLLLLGVFTRAAALIMGLHLAVIAFSLGYSAIAVRDWGLTIALLGFALTDGGLFSVVQKRVRR